MDIGGFSVPIINSSSNINSEILSRLSEGKPFAAAYFDVWCDDCVKRVFSLRSCKGGEDVSLIAKKYGGGGHKHAAGFSVEVCKDHFYIDITKKNNSIDLAIKKKIEDFNNDNARHIQLVQQLCFFFYCDMMPHEGKFKESMRKTIEEVILHDLSKWSPEEYWGFIGIRESLKMSKDGKDKDYQKALASNAIKNHYKMNAHHAEHYKSGEKMPFYEVVIMFFDWMSRSIQKGNDMEGFWHYNISKTKHLVNQDEVLEILNELRSQYDVNSFSYDIKTGRLTRCFG